MLVEGIGSSCIQVQLHSTRWQTQHWYRGYLRAFFVSSCMICISNLKNLVSILLQILVERLDYTRVFVILL